MSVPIGNHICVTVTLEEYSWPYIQKLEYEAIHVDHYGNTLAYLYQNTRMYSVTVDICS